MERFPMLMAWQNQFITNDYTIKQSTCSMQFPSKFQ
jgi:hypothetical protein